MRITRKNKMIRTAAVIFCVFAMLAMIAPTALAADSALTTGSSGSAVTSLQNRLINLGYCDFSEASVYFGSLTRTAVIRFQSIHGLTADGVVGYATSSKLYSSAAKNLVLNIGSNGEAVSALQARLASLGYFSGSATGYYGSVTKSAVAGFQQACGLSADGIAGPATRTKLFSPNAPYKQAASQSKIAVTALAQLGKTYVLSTEGPDTFDCSGLAYYSMINAGFKVSRFSASAYSEVSSWAKITSTSLLQKGDLLFFRSDTSSYVSHMGIYVGNGDFVHASSGQSVVMTSNLSNTYWARNLVFARRVS